MNREHADGSFHFHHHLHARRTEFTWRRERHIGRFRERHIGLFQETRLRHARRFERRSFAHFERRSFAHHHRIASGEGLIRASFYSSGRRTASGEPFHPGGFTAAHRTLPFGTRLRLTNPSTGRTVTVRVNDRGPFVAGRSLDVSRGAAAALGMISEGTATLRFARI